MKKISYSQYSQWAVCPHRWKLMYIEDRRDFKGNIHTLFGSAMHDVLQMYLTVMYNDSIKKADSLPLSEMLLTRMKHYFSEIVDSSGEEPSSKAEMGQFYQHGLAIIEWFVKKRAMYFSKKGYELVGIEVPIDYDIDDNIKFIGYIDVLIKDTVRDRYKIIDIKTSTMGWNKWAKADKNKTDQLLLYKKYYGEQNNIPLDKIDIEYFIVKRKIWENADFPQRRIQTFIPANGKPSVNKVAKNIDSFITECFNGSEYNVNHIYRKEASKKNCRFCEFNQTEHCDAGVK